MSVFRLGLVCGLVGAGGSAVLGADERLDIAPIVSEGGPQTRLSFSVELQAFECAVENDWTILRFADAEARPWGEVGRPESFALRRLISIPADARVLAVDVRAQPEARSLARPLRPGVESVPWNQPQPVPEPDPAVYRSAEPYPARDFDWRIVRQGGGSLLELTLYPFKYVGARQTLVAYRTMNVEIRLDCPAWPAATEPRGKLERRLRARVVNPESACFASPSRKPRAAARGLVSGGWTDYLILAPAAWTNALDDYVATKSAHGWSPRVFSVEDVYANYAGDGGRTNILNFIRDACSNWPVSHVLLVGDVDHVPSGDYVHEFDQYYALLDGANDYYPDVYLGRLPAATHAEAQAISSRWADYDSRGWGRREFCLTGEDIGFPATNDYAAYGWTVVCMDGSNVFRTLTTNDVINHVNAACGLINWCGHGNPRFWVVEGGDYVGDPTNFNYKVDHALARTQPRLAFINAAISCDTGQFADSNCVASAFFRAPDSGVIGYVGANDLVWLGGVQLDTPVKTYFDRALREEYLETGYAHPAEIFIDVIAGNMRWVKLFNLLGDPTARMDLRPWLPDLQAPSVDDVAYSRTNVLVGETISISVAASDNDQIGVVRTAILGPDGAWATNELPYDPSTGRYVADFGQEQTAQTGRYVVAVQARDISQNVHWRFGSNLWVAADLQPPEIAGFGLSPTSTYQLESVGIAFAATDNVGLAECYADVVRPGLAVERIALGNGWTTYYTNTALAGDYQVQACARDHAGQTTATNGRFRILADTQPPRILDAWSSGTMPMGPEDVQRLWQTNACPAHVFFNVVATDNVTVGWSMQSFLELEAPDSTTSSCQMGADGFWPEHFLISQTLSQTGTYAVGYSVRDRVGNTGRSARQYFHVAAGGALMGDLSRQSTQLWLQVATPCNGVPRIDVSTNLLPGGAWHAATGAGAPFYTNGYYVIPFPADSGPQLFYRATITN